MILLMIELDGSFRGVDGSFKSSGYKLITISDLLPWKTTESMLYDVLRSHEWIISSETTSWSEQEYVDKLVLWHSNCGLGLFCGFDSTFVVDKSKG